MRKTIDLNADLGEGAGSDEQMLGLVSSANIACGLHAGNPASILATIEVAKRLQVAIGAHPSLNDRVNFGRSEQGTSPDEVFALTTYQVGAMQALCRAARVKLRHVKPHGALYHMAARERPLADAVARAIAGLDSGLILFGPPASALVEAGREKGLTVAMEFFADRNYLPDGSLVPRSRSDALLPDAKAAAARALQMLRENRVRAVDGSDVALSAETICVHGDTPQAVEFVRALRAELEGAGIAIRAPRSQS
ncbi:MAG: 5-oxoprolinase subunit PxpA [Verrucomicrobiota bacterium]